MNRRLEIIKMGIMDKFMNAMRLNADDEEYYDDEIYDEDDYEEDEPSRSPGSLFRRHDSDRRSTQTTTQTRSQSAAKPASSNKITPMRSARRASSAPVMEVCVIKPKTVDDSREITETLLENRTIVLNLEGIDLEIGQRIIDFTSGSCFAIGGNLQKVSNYIFIATPANVDISGDFQSIVDAFNVSSFQMDI